MPSRGKLEGRITVPSGGWDASLTGTSSGTATIPAGEYYLSSEGDGSNDLLAEVASQFSSTTGDTVTCTGSLGEAGSGKITLASDGGTFEVTWTDTDLRDVLGFESDGNLSGDTSYTSAESARSVWIPDGTPPQRLNGNEASVNWAGWQESDKRTQSNMAGYTYALAGQKHTRDEIVWPAIKRERIWKASESVASQSFETWWEDTIFGGAAWADRPGGPFRYYPDADTDGTYRTYVALDLDVFRPDQMIQHWTGRFAVRTGLLIEHPGGGTATSTDLNAFETTAFENTAFE